MLFYVTIMVLQVVVWLLLSFVCIVWFCNWDFVCIILCFACCLFELFLCLLCMMLFFVGNVVYWYFTCFVLFSWFCWFSCCIAYFLVTFDFGFLVSYFVCLFIDVGWRYFLGGCIYCFVDFLVIYLIVFYWYDLCSWCFCFLFGIYYFVCNLTVCYWFCYVFWFDLLITLMIFGIWCCYLVRLSLLDYFELL